MTLNSSKVDAIADSVERLDYRLECMVDDASPETIERIKALYRRPGTSGEKAAAGAALERLGVHKSEWEEEKHPRDESGQFSSSSSSKSGGGGKFEETWRDRVEGSGFIKTTKTAHGTRHGHLFYRKGDILIVVSPPAAIKMGAPEWAFYHTNQWPRGEAIAKGSRRVLRSIYESTLTDDYACLRR